MVKKVKNKISLNKKKLLVAAIVVLVFIAGWLMVSKPNPKIRIAIDEVFSLSEKIRSAYKNRPDYWKLNGNTLLEQGTINKLTNVFGSEIIIGQGLDGDISMPGAKSFDVVYNNLNRSECIALSSFKLEEAKSLGLLAIVISDGEKEVEFSWGEENGLPVGLYDAKKHCKQKNKVLWRFE